ncbi:3'-5' exonuclease [Flavobacterium sp. LB2P84]|uniref:3'-5' exonuclease n=1 Tax=Flavobacterium yafengii TaxID=3041253 RepID=UPI0024A86CCA|nr:3'-5' exonuclease [Flavobacterium yafengii]MDI6034006.1 3'-5' exonuclease [Flavobacterium yafengii]
MSKILIIDIETTGFLQQNGKIVEIGIIELDLLTGERIILFDEVCHEVGITLEEMEKSWIVQNSNLTVKMVKYSGSIESKRKRIQKILNDYPLGATAFNNAFDFGFLEHRGFVFPKKLPCPMKLSTDICKIPHTNGLGFKWPKVEEAHLHFFGNVGYVEKHRGADDAYFEAEIVYELFKRGVFLIDK